MKLHNTKWRRVRRDRLGPAMAQGIFLMGVVAALPLHGGEFESWKLPGGATAEVVAAEGLKAELKLPALTKKQQGVEAKWSAVVSLDVHGCVRAGAGSVRAELFDLPTGEVFASATAPVQGQAERAAWAVVASSAQGESAADAFDGNPNTQWHSRYGANQPKPPHWIGIEFGEPTLFSGIRYLPRQGGFTNGVARRYRLEIRRPGKVWEEMAAGETDRKVVADRREALTLALDAPVEIEAFRMVIESDWSGGGFGTAAEISLLSGKLPQKKSAAPAKHRLWLSIPGALVARLGDKPFGVRVKPEGDQAVVVGTPRLAYFHETPNSRLLGKANGVLGPDKLGAGLLGFTGLLEHRVDATSVMSVREGGPALLAGMKVGDVIVAVDGRPLPTNDLAPGYRWFEQSHEAILGRAGELALNAKRSVDLTVLRGGKPVSLKITLPVRAPFTTLDPKTDPAAAAMLSDLLTWLRERQREDGSWSGDIIRTTFSSLALLATGEEEDEDRVRRAVEWSMAKYPQPKRYGNLGFWSGAYAGILYSEWHLRTADERVLGHLDSLRDWAVAGQHESVWKVPALGHGPSGLPYGNKSLVAPSCHLLVYEALAMRCGMKSEIWELLLPYMEMSWSDPADGGHGSLGYNRSYKDRGEFWSRTGLFAMASQLRGARQDMRDSMTGFMREQHPYLRNSHAYGEPGGAWGLLALNLASPKAFEEVMKAHVWWFSLAWEPGYGLRFTTPHMGAPYMGEEDLINAAYAVVLQARLKSLHLTGQK